MPEFIACPACGCRVQMADSMFGKTSAASPATTALSSPPPAGDRNAALGTAAGARTAFGAGMAARRRRGPYRVPSGEPDDDRPPRDADLPCCPACGWRVPWEALRCGQCGVELEIDAGYDRFRPPTGGRLRRDCLPHRGSLLSAMGAVTLIAGGLTLCLFGVPLLVTLPLGITTWLMAAGDLEKMRTGEMDDRGRGQTESGRTSAVFGVILSLFFAAGWGLMLLSRVLP